MSEQLPDKLLELVKTVGKERITKYKSYIDKHEQFVNYTNANITASYGAVLLHNQIKELCDDKLDFPLIHRFFSKQLKGASYHLSIGNRYRDESGVHNLTDRNRVITIPRNGIAIVTTNEWVNIPRFLVARWNLRVQMVYRGLVWVGSLQVDPGYQGFLFCPIYNLSNQAQQLSLEEEVFTIDFVLTNQFDEGKVTGHLWKPPEDDKYMTFNFDRLDKEFQIQSAPLTDFQNMDIKIQDLGTEMKSHSRHMTLFQTATFTVLAVIITALTILASLKASDDKFNIRFIPENWIPYAGLVIAIVALLLSIICIFTVFSSTRNRKNKK